jgi:beta-lactam-binding protein with PASTA domain
VVALRTRVFARTFVLVLAVALPECATTRFGVLEGVLVGDNLATGPEIGGVRILRPGEAPATVPGMDLRKGDRIVTGPDVGALVTLDAGYQLILEPDTDIEILNPSLFMRAGTAFVQTLQNVREYLKLKTEFAVAGVEGTQFVATVSQEELNVTVVEGHVRVESPTGAWPAKVYAALERGRVVRGSTPEKMAPLDPVRRDVLRARFLAVAALPHFGGRGGAAAGTGGREGGAVGTGGRGGAPVEDKSILVPELRGRPVAQAASELKEAGLGMSRTEALDLNAPDGVVVKQSPEPGTRVRPEAIVHLTVAVAGVRVPDLTRLDERGAANRLREAGLVVGQTSPVATSAVEAGAVAHQDPAPGTIVRRGTPVHFQIAAASTTCTVPTLRGRTEAEAKTMLSRAGLKLGRVQRSGDASSPSDTVTEQRPRPGARVRCGTPVEVSIPGQFR